MLKVSPCTVGRPVVQIFRLDGLFALVMGLCRACFTRCKLPYNHLARCDRRNYIISSVMHAFLLVLTYDLLESRPIDDVIIKTFFNTLLYKTNRFQVAVRLFSNRSQRRSKCDALGCASCATFLLLPHFDVICDLLLNRRTATWNLFVE